MYETMNTTKPLASRDADTCGGSAWVTVSLLGAVLTLALTLNLTVNSFAGGATGPSGDDLGSLPGITGGGGWVVSRIDTRPAFSLEGGAVSDISSAILDAEGDGDIDVYSLPDGGVRYLFRGNLRVRLDENVLALNDVKVGLTAPGGTNPLLAQAVLQNQVLTPVTIAPGETLELPLERMHMAGMLDARLRTFHPVHLDGSIDLYSHGQQLTVVVKE